MMEFAKRIQNVKPSATFKYATLAKKPGVIDLTIGRPDFDTPKIIKEAAKKALDEGKVHYVSTKGIPELREKISEKLKVENKIQNIDKEKVLVGGGAKSILFQAIMAIIDKDDTVGLPNPSWVSYEEMINLAEGRVKWIGLKPENGFIPDEDFLSSLENSDLKLLIINSPNNPTGAVYSKKILEKIIDICERKGLWLISDECYDAFLYEGNQFSLASVYENTLTVNAFSKRYSMTGWRLGYAACQNSEVIEKMTLVQEQSLSCCTSFAQYGALAAFTKEANEDSKKMVSDFKKRRDYCMDRLGKLDVICKRPSGAFYVFPLFRGWDDLKLADKLLENGVGVVPGSPFGSNGKGCVRISYGSGNVNILKEAFDRIERALK